MKVRITQVGEDCWWKSFDFSYDQKNELFENPLPKTFPLFCFQKMANHNHNSNNSRGIFRPFQRQPRQSSPQLKLEQRSEKCLDHFENFLTMTISGEKITTYVMQEQRRKSSRYLVENTHRTLLWITGVISASVWKLGKYVGKILRLFLKVMSG